MAKLPAARYHTGTMLDPSTQYRMSSAMVRALVEAVHTAGIAPGDFVVRAGINAAQMADPYAWFALAEFDRLVAMAVNMTGDPAFGLHWGERSPLMQFDLASTLTATAPTLRMAIMLSVRAQPIFLSHPATSFVESAERCACVFKVTASNDVGLHVGTELSMASTARLVRYYARDAIRRVNFAYARPWYVSEYERVLGPTLFFEQAESSLELDRGALDGPGVARNAELHEELANRMEQARDHVLGQVTIAQRVQQQVRTSLPRVPAMADLARALELSERSLRRRLVDEGTGYSELVDRVQRERAAELVAAGQRPAKQIAAALGFDSVSGYQRAARRWAAQRDTKRD